MVGHEKGAIDSRWYVVPRQENVGLGNHTHAGGNGRSGCAQDGIESLAAQPAAEAGEAFGRKFH